MHTQYSSTNLDLFILKIITYCIPEFQDKRKMAMKLVVKTTLKFRQYIVTFDIQSVSLDTYILHDLLIDKKITQTIHIHSYIGTYNRDINS